MGMERVSGMPPFPAIIFFRKQETSSMKDKNLLGFIVIDILLALGIIWGLWNGYKLLGYGLLVYFIINTLALVLKLAGNKKNGDDEQ